MKIQVVATVKECKRDDKRYGIANYAVEAEHHDSVGNEVFVTFDSSKPLLPDTKLQVRIELADG